MNKTQKAAVIGHPIAHTMSPFLQKRLFELSSMPMEYEVIDVPEISEFMPRLKKLDCFNVTIPHKQNIIPFLDETDEKARACGSVNSVRVKNGRLYGATTDGSGCYEALRLNGLNFSGRLLLLGNGGAARAIAFEAAAREKDVDLTIVCRKSSLNKAEILKDELKAFSKGRGEIRLTDYESLEEDGSKYDLLLNATSVGMTPRVGVSPVSGGVISRCGAVFDAVYNPRETELLRIARGLNKKVVGGMEMLVFQAVEAHRFWYGTSFSDEDILKLIDDAQEALEGRKPL